MIAPDRDLKRTHAQPLCNTRSRVFSGPGGLPLSLDPWPTLCIRRANHDLVHRMRSTTLFLFLAVCTSAFAQTEIPQLPASGKAIGDFIPQRWVAIETAYGDLNRDGTDDVALVLQCQDTIPGDTTGRAGASPAPPRKLVVLMAMEGQYRLVLDNDRFVLRADEGGLFDPFAGVAIEAGMLVLRFYGGSALRYSNSYTFRYARSGFRMTAAEAVSYHAATGEGVSHNIDLVNDRMRVTTGNMTQTDEPTNTSEEKVLNRGTGPLPSFETFVRPFTWRFDDDLVL